MTSIRKRIWKSPNGEAKQAWQVDYRDSAGKRRSKQFQRKKEAEAWRVPAEFQVSQGTHTPDSKSITIADAAALWLDKCRSDNLEPTTIAAYDQHIRLHITPLCGAAKLSQITTPGVEGYRDRLIANLSRPMALRVLRSLKAIIWEAQRRGLVAQNVASNVKMPRKDRDQKKPIIPTKAELTAILQATQSEPQAMALACLAIFTGLRASELRGLYWVGLNLTAATVTVSQRADATGQIGPPKSKAGFRTIPIPEMAVKALKQWKLACPPGDLVFPSLAGKVMSHPYMTGKIMGPVQVAAGLAKEGLDGPLPRYGLHAFRHAAASLWIDQKVTAKRIQVWMGHGSIQVTFDTYGHLFDQADQDAVIANAVEASLFLDAT